MNAMVAFCGIVLAGWVGPDFTEPISPTPDKLPLKPARQQQSNPQSAGVRPARAVYDVAMRGPRMPVPPTDPRAYTNGELPLPPTMNDSGMMRNVGMAGMGPQQDGADNGGRRSTGQRAFDHYRAAPGTSPYMLLNGSTNNGTVNPYAAYVRPAQDQQRAVQELDQAENAADQPGPIYPRAFQNYGSYYPDYGIAR